MSQTEKLYEVITEAEEIVKQLKEQYPDELWAIRPEIITVLGVTNKDRPKNSKKLASVRSIKGTTKALMVLNRVNTRYIIELYCTDWNTWSKAQKESVIFHELLHPDYEVGKIVKHDVEDFQIMIDKLGCNWFGNKDLPSLLETKVDFDLSLRPNVPEDGGLEVDTGDEIVEDVDEEQTSKEENDEGPEIDEGNEGDPERDEGDELF